LASISAEAVSNFAPQWAQNTLPAAFSAPQAEQRMFASFPFSGRLLSFFRRP
jgi:hypothetical protein